MVELPNSELLQDSIKGMTPTLPNHFHRIVQHSRPQTITQILTMTTIVSTLSPFNIPPQPLSSSPRLSCSFSQNHLASPPFHPRNNYHYPNIPNPSLGLQTAHLTRVRSKKTGPEFLSPNHRQTSSVKTKK